MEGRAWVSSGTIYAFIQAVDRLRKHTLRQYWPECRAVQWVFRATGADGTLADEQVHIGHPARSRRELIEVNGRRAAGDVDVVVVQGRAERRAGREAEGRGRGTKHVHTAPQLGRVELGCVYMHSNLLLSPS